MSTQIICPACHHCFSLYLNPEEQRSKPSKELTCHCSKCDHLFSVTLTTDRENEVRGTENIPPSSLDGEQVSLPFPDKPKPTVKILKETTPAGPAKRLSFGKAPKKLSKSAIQEPLIDLPAPNTIIPADSSKRVHSEPPTTNPALLWPSALLGITVLLFLFSHFLVTENTISKSVASLLTGQVTVPAPAELRMHSLELTPLTLQSGEEIALVKGSLKNNATRDFDQVLIEVALFNREGSLLKQEKLPLSENNNRRTRVELLPAKVLFDMQHRAALEKSRIRTGEELSFEVALPLHEVPEASYYSVRVHSVRG